MQPTEFERRPTFQVPAEGDNYELINLLIARAESVFEKALESTRALASVSCAVERVHQESHAESQKVLRVINSSDDPARHLACAPGCSHCCYRVPELSLPELALIWNQIRGSFTSDQFAQLNARVAAYTQETAHYRPKELLQARAACPFLVDSKCSIYEVRPLSCQALNSTNSNKCAAIRAKELAPEERPFYPDLVLITMALRTGLRVGAFFESLEGYTVDLGFALGVLLQDPSALDKYLEGKERFAAAKSGFECEAMDFDTVAGSKGPAYYTESELELPSGNLPVTESQYFANVVTKYLQDGNFQGYISNLAGDSVARRMARIQVPRIAHSEEEIDATRETYVKLLREFRESDFCPTEAFNALSYHHTMNLPYQGRDDVDILREHGQMLVQEITGKSLPQFSQPREGSRRPGKLRVGYVSGNLNASNNGQWARTWIKNHSKEIETFCFHIGTRSDSVTNSFRALADHFYWLGRSVPHNAEFIKSFDLDAIIFTDMGLYSRTLQYGSMRLAPIQCTAWGRPATSGLKTIDYHLTADYMEPVDGEKHYVEKLFRLPHSGILFEKGMPRLPEYGRAHYGLPASGPLLFMAQAAIKLVPKYDYLFARICERGGSEIVFLESKTPGDTRIVKERLQKAGVRAKWLPALSHIEYLGLLKLADVSIDTHMWSSANTAIQALTLGTPVVSWPGPFMRSRHSLGFLRQVNATGLVAKDEDDYIDLVCNFDRQKEAMRDMDANLLYNDYSVLHALDEFLFSHSEI